jgi:hypothetical protein
VLVDTSESGKLGEKDRVAVRTWTLQSTSPIIGEESVKNLELRIVVGDGVCALPPPPSPVETVTARSCMEVRRLLWGLSRVELVIADFRLPDGSWHDIVRTVASERIPGHLYVLGSDGRLLFGCAIGPGSELTRRAGGLRPAPPAGRQAAPGRLPVRAWPATAGG